jgi:hypothetical protein
MLMATWIKVWFHRGPKARQVARQGMITMIVALERDIGTLSLVTVPVEIDDALRGDGLWKHLP